MLGSNLLLKRDESSQIINYITPDGQEIDEKKK